MGNAATTTSPRFNQSTCKLLSRFTQDLHTLILNGQRLDPIGYASIVRDLEALQAAAAKIVTDLSAMAEKG